MPEPEPPDFYVGYAERAPAGIARRVRAALIAIFCIVIALGLVLPAAQGPSVSSAFEFGSSREFVGWLRAQPYPQLLVPTPGSGPGGHSLSAWSLVGEGKLGAAPQVAGLDGAQVRLTGSLIYVADQTMIEVVGGSVRRIDDAQDRPESLRESLGTHTLAGEIVDSKCYFGVMNPATGKVHRACATRCISGGMPPVLLVRDDRGNSLHLLLVGRDDRSLNHELLDLVAEPVRVTGEVLRYDNLLVLRADPDSYERIE